MKNDHLPRQARDTKERKAEANDVSIDISAGGSRQSRPGAEEANRADVLAKYQAEKADREAKAAAQEEK